MKLAHDSGVAAVVVPGGSRGQRAGLGILQHRLGIIGAVPVMVVSHHFGAEMRGSQRRRQRLAKELRLLGRQHLHAAVGRRCKQGFVLHAKRPYRHPSRLVALDGLHQVMGERRVIFGPQGGGLLGLILRSQHGRGRLHPSGRAPRRQHHMNRRVQSESLLELRENVLLIVCQRKVVKVGIVFPVRRSARVRRLLAEVIEGVKRDRQIRRADRLAQKTERDSVLAAEQHLERGVGLRGRQLLGKQPGRGIGQRGAEAINLLKALRIIDSNRCDGCLRRSFQGEMQLLPHR